MPSRQPQPRNFEMEIVDAHGYLATFSGAVIERVLKTKHAVRAYSFPVIATASILSVKSYNG